MVALSRKFCAGRRVSILIPRHLFQQEAPKPDQQPFIPFSQLQHRKLLKSRLIFVLHDCNDLNRIKQVHGHVVRKGLDQCFFVLTKLIRMLIKVGDSIDSCARLVFEQVKQPNPFLWTALIRGYSVQGPFSESILLYNCMRRDGTGSVSFTFSALLKAGTAALVVDLGRQIHAQTITIGGFASDLYVGNTMINMYVKCGFLDCGRRVFDEMPERDVISWTC